MKFYQVDAFAEKVFEGNPAAIVPLEEWLPDELMQKIADENNLSETAFFVKEGVHYHIRWFTPADEVDLCGHATLATAFVINKFVDPSLSTISFNSRSGILTVEVLGDDRYKMNFPQDTFEVRRPPIGLVESFGIMPLEIKKGKDDYLLVINSEQELKDLTPDFGMLSKVDARGVIVTAPGENHDFVSRCFYPVHGILEDPVTGSAHTTSAPYWAKKLGKSKLSARQLSKRGGNIDCEIVGDRVNLTGSAVLYAEGDFHF